MKTFNQLTKPWKFDYINSGIGSNFPLTERKHGQYKLFHFKRFISSEDAVMEMEKEGFMPANLLELLEWKEWSEKDFVAALGSVVRVNGRRGVPYLDGYDSKRGLHLYNWDGDWRAYCRFLAVRNVSQKLEPKNSDSVILGHLDALEEIIREIRSELE